MKQRFLMLPARGTAPIRTALALSIAVAFGAAGCANGLRVDMADPGQAAFVQILLPAAIEVQHYLTQPVSYENRDAADGVEVILAATDRFDDRMKVIGVFNFELYAPKGSGPDLGERIALWTVSVASADDLARYWDRATRYFRFPLRLEDPPTLPSGRYLIEASFISPWSDKLFDRYEFEYQRPTASP